MFGEIRTMKDEQGEAWFVGKDVAVALGYSNTRDALRKRVDDEDRRDDVAICDAIGRQQKTVFINESGLYSLILSSKLPSAKLFKRWVTAEVLPQIRKTGGYIPLRDADGRELTPEEVLERADDILAETLEMKNESTLDCLSASELAKTYNMDVTDFNAVLADLGIQQYRNGRWHLAPKLKGLGLTDDRLYVYYSMRGDRRQKIYMVWTPAGVDYLRKTLS